MKITTLARCWWLMPVMLATLEAEIGMIEVPGQSEKTVLYNQLQNNEGKMDWSCGSSSRVPALEA
jgi:hypothetical protein